MSREEKALKIALVTGLNTGRKQDSWMMAHRYITQALQKLGAEVRHIGPITLKGDLLLAKVLNKIAQVFLKKRFLYYQSLYISKRYAHVASRLLAKYPTDVIIAPAGDAFIPFLKTDIPIILIEGASFALLCNYYPQYSNVLKRSLYEANLLQELAFKKASYILNPSAWGARSIIEDYQTEPQKVRILPYGANIETPPALETILAKRSLERCRLLFVGVDWQRKGGDIAFDTLVKLEEMGVDAELTVCGCVPPAAYAHEHMQVIPFLDKSNKEQKQQLQDLYSRATFFILPTRQELFGFVFSEASAFGLPAITANTGGVAGAIKEGENGWLLPLSAGGAEYAEVIARIYRDKSKYNEIVRTSRAAFDERLNWDSWAATVNTLIVEMLKGEEDVQGIDDISGVVLA